MKKEDRELVLKDLTARLPYGVNMLFNNSHIFTLHQINPNESTRKDGYGVIFDFGRTYSVNDCKPYLRPMSSMTEEESNDLANIYKISKTDSEYIANCTDYLLSRHLDYHNLIPKGLALEAPKDMYNEIKEEAK